MWVRGQKTPEEAIFELSTGHKWAEGSCPTTCCLCAELGWRVPLAFFTHWPRYPGNVTSRGILAAGCHLFLWLSHHCWAWREGKVSSIPLGGRIHQEKEEIFHSSHELSKGAGMGSCITGFGKEKV